MKKHLLLVACAATCSGVHAELDLAINAGYERQTNINRDNDNPIDDNVSYAGAELSWEELGRNMHSDFDYSYRHEKYDKFGSRNQIQGSGFVDLYNSTRRYGWYFSNRVEDRLVNVFLSDSPNNVNRVTTSYTGPYLVLKPSRVDDLVFRATKGWVQSESDSESENSSADSESLNFSVDWKRRLNTRTNIGLSVNNSEVEPSDEVVNKYTVNSARLTANRRFASGEFLFEWGVSESSAKKTDGSNVGDVSEYLSTLNIDFGRLGNFELSAEKQLASTGMGSASGEATNLAGSDTFSVDINKVIRMSHNVDLWPQRLSYLISYSQSEQERLILQDNVDIDELTNQLTYTFQNSSAIRAFYARSDRSSSSSEDSVGSDERSESRFGLSFTWPITTKWSARCEYERQKLEADGNASIAGCAVSFEMF